MNLLTIYVTAVVAAGAWLFASFAPAALPPVTLTLTLLAAMMTVSLFKLRLPVPDGQSTISMAFAVDFVALLTVGADVAMAIAAAGVLLQCLVRARRRQPWYRTAFSVATVAIAVQAAGWTLEAARTGAAGELASTFVPLVLAAAVYFAVNAALVAGAIALATGRMPLRGLVPFAATAPGHLVGAAVAAVVAVLVPDQALLALLAGAVPLLAMHAGHRTVFRRMASAPPLRHDFAGV